MSLSCLNLSSGYGQTKVLDHVSLQFKQGEVVALLGANGCGKTTLLRTLLGLIPIQSGSVLVAQSPLANWSAAQLAKQVAYVPQLHRLSFGYTALDVVLMGVMAGRSLFAQPSPSDMDLARYWLTQLNIAHLSERMLTQVSGGQRQLVMIARAMAQQAQFVLLDEPTNGLDYANQHRLLALLTRLASDKQGIVFTSHDPTHARRYASRVVMMREGRLVGDGHPSQCLRDEDLHKIYDLEGVALFD